MLTTPSPPWAQPLFLLLQNSRRTNEWTPVSGIYERTDGDARTCALRQLREECGMTLAEGDLKAGFVYRTEYQLPKPTKSCKSGVRARPCLSCCTVHPPSGPGWRATQKGWGAGARRVLRMHVSSARRA